MFFFLFLRIRYFFAQLTTYDKTLDMWEPGAEVTTSVVKFNITGDDGTPVETDDPFQIAFDNPDEIIWWDASANFSVIRNTTLMFYHAVEVSDRDADGGAVVVEIGASEDVSTPEIYIKRGLSSE